MKRIRNLYTAKPCFFFTKRILIDPNFENDLFLIRSGNLGSVISLKNEYEFDGCTPKIEILDLIIGTPDGAISKRTGKPKTYYASLVHDILYEYSNELPNSITRKQADLIFLDELRKESFLWADLYYYAVRLFGRWSWKK